LIALGQIEEQESSSGSQPTTIFTACQSPIMNMDMGRPKFNEESSKIFGQEYIENKNLLLRVGLCKGSIVDG